MVRIFSVIILLVLVIIAVFMYTVNTAHPEAQKLFLPKDSEKEDLAKNNDPKKWLTLILAENNEICYYRGNFDNDVVINKTDYRSVREVLLNKKKEIGNGLLVLIKSGG